MKSNWFPTKRKPAQAGSAMRIRHSVAVSRPRSSMKISRISTFRILPLPVIGNMALAAVLGCGLWTADPNHDKPEVFWPTSVRSDSSPLPLTIRHGLLPSHSDDGVPGGSARDRLVGWMNGQGLKEGSLHATAKFAFNHIALLVDGDNAQPSLIEPILTEVAKHGSITTRRIYGDWTTPHMSGGKKFCKPTPSSPFNSSAIR